VKVVDTVEWRTEADRVLIRTGNDPDEFLVVCSTVTVDDLLELKKAIEDILLRQQMVSTWTVLRPRAEKGQVK